MIKLKKIIKEIMDAVPPAPQQNVQQAQSNVLSSGFIDYMKFVENNKKEGYDQSKKLWFPHKSFEGGMPTIGYGHKIKNKHELEAFKKGISDSDVLKNLTNDLTVANKLVHEYIKKKYKTDVMLNQKQSEMLIDFAFNLGGLDKFPKFADAVLRNKFDLAKKEYKRYSGGKELTGRNTAFFNRFLK